jgi:branched-chain amino acid transport system substrate-binding protein
MRSQKAEAAVRQGGRARRRLVFAAAVGALAASIVLGGGSAWATSRPAVPASALKAALAYTGGKAGPANNSLSPLYVGWVSDETAITGHAGNTDGVVAAINLIDKNLGGVDGHPLKLVSCPITSTDAQGATCAQLFLNRSNVQVVTEGELLTGESSFIGTMNGQKPVISIFTHGKGADPNTFYLDGAIQGQLASVTYLANNVHAKNVSIIGPDIPGVAPILAMFKGLFATLGVNSTVVTYPNAATDITAAIAASGASSADGLFVVGSTSDECIALAKAFSQLGLNSKPVVSLPECLEPAVKQALGDWPKWTFVYTSKNPAAPYAKGGQMDAYKAAMASYSNPANEQAGFSPLTFGMILTIDKWMTELGPSNVNSATIAQKAAAFTGPMYLGDSKLIFGQAPFPAIGSIRALFYTYKGNNAFNEVSGGQWICPPVTASGCPS